MTEFFQTSKGGGDSLNIQDVGGGVVPEKFYANRALEIWKILFKILSLLYIHPPPFCVK